MRAIGPAAAALWVLACVAWFDPAAAWRPGFLGTAAPALVALALVAIAAWLVATWRRWPAETSPRSGRTVMLVLAATVLFRLPLLWHGAAGYVTPDGALSGIVALHVRDGVEHLVFVPRVPYSGSLKSHLTAPLAALVDPVRAFALASVLFYVAFVAGVMRLAARAAPASPRVPLAAGLFLAFAPTFVTRYSLSNDGNYVEILAFGTWALVVAGSWRQNPGHRESASWILGLLLGLAFWCHILAVVHVAAVGLMMLMAAPRDALRNVLRLGGGFALGYTPGLLWNAVNRWESFLYVVPGGRPVGTLEQGPGLAGRAVGMVLTQWPVLFGYDPGYPEPWDTLLKAVGWGGVALALVAVLAAIRSVREVAVRDLLVFTAVAVVVAWAALPLIDGNPRYLLVLMASLPVLMARLSHAAARVAFGVLVAANATASLAQAPGSARSDAAIRAFVADLEQAGITACTSDFFLATRVTFVSGERIACSSELGPTTTEYFEVFRTRVAQAPQVAFIAVNGAAADRIERRLQRIGVTWQRFDGMKPVILPARRVEVAELQAARAQPEGSSSVNEAR